MPFQRTFYVGLSAGHAHRCLAGPSARGPVCPTMRVISKIFTRLFATAVPGRRPHWLAIRSLAGRDPVQYEAAIHGMHISNLGLILCRRKPAFRGAAVLI